MSQSKRPSRFAIVMAAIALLVVVCAGMLVFLRSGLLQSDVRAHGVTVLQVANQSGPLQNESQPHESGTSLGFGPLEGTGPLKGGGPFDGGRAAAG